MVSTLVERRLHDFEHRCGSVGLRLAYHAALPVALNPELLHFIRINFFAEELPYTVEFEFLTSGLCREIGSNLYEIEPEIRNELLLRLAKEDNAKNIIIDVATLLWQYLERHSPWTEQVELERAQQLTALNFLSPQKARQWLEEAQKRDGEVTGVEREWFVAMRHELDDLPQVNFFVLKVQKALIQAGFELVIDGMWGPATERAVRQFQQKRGLTPDGFVGPLTLQALGIETPPPTLQSFEFDVVTVNKTGQEMSRKKERAQYFSEDLGGGVTLEMVAIPGGKFMMGSPPDEKDSFDDERPQQEVTVPPFFMGKFQVTQAQWRAIADCTELKVERELERDPSSFKGDDRPVELVSWYDAVEFCGRLSKLTGWEYRLPSEAEWEYACRAGTTTPFHFGETITGKLANYDASRTYASEPKGEYRKQTTPVGQFPPNAFGLYDMHGNVFEWCADTWHEDYNGAPTDSSAWIQGGNDNRSPLRGGSWFNNPYYCRSAYRNIDVRERDSIDLHLGLRVVCGVGRTH